MNYNLHANMLNKSNILKMDLIEKFDYINGEINKYVQILLEDVWEDITLEKLILIYINILKEQSLETENLVILKMVLEKIYSLPIDNDEELEDFINLAHQLYNSLND